MHFFALFKRRKKWYYGLYFRYLLGHMKYILFLDLNIKNTLFNVFKRNDIKVIKIKKSLFYAFLKQPSTLNQYIYYNLFGGWVICCMSNDLQRLLLFFQNLEKWNENKHVNYLFISINGILYNYLSFKNLMSTAIITTRKKFLLNFIGFLQKIKLIILYLINYLKNNANF